MSYEILRTVKGQHGTVVLEWVDGQLTVWLSVPPDGETAAVRLDRLGIYQLYADLAVINAAADGYANPPSAVPLEAT